MAKVTISEVEPLQPECLFTDPFKFKIRFNCIEDLQDDLDWKIIYVGSANSNQHDQGNSKFQLFAIRYLPRQITWPK